MVVRMVLFRLLLAILVFEGVTFAADEPVKIIEWGWNTPHPAYVKEHIREMERLPFDGLVLDLQANSGKSGETNLFSWNVWSPRVLDLSDYQESYDALRQTDFKRFTDNFLRFNVTPGVVDWFDKEFSCIVANASSAAQIAKSCGLKGILLDVEHYYVKPFSYPNQPGRDSHSFEDYQKQVRQCGQRFMQAINKAFPDITILLTFGYQLAHYNGTTPDKEEYGLLPSFLDGMLEAASPDSLIIDGWEYSYGYRTEEQFKAARERIYKELATREGLQEAARRRFRCSFGLWLDNKLGWSESDPKLNYFSPQGFCASLRFALKHSDRYVWIYSQKPNWWNAEMPQPYVDALTQARSSSNSEASPSR